jgi:adenine-specific DNA-methyltransferase
MSIGLIQEFDSIRHTFNGNSHRSNRSKIGQFLTPVKIAQFMANLFEKNCENVRILDAGAGTGVLFAAAVENLISRKLRPRKVEVLAYENDSLALPYLREALRHCEAACRKAGIKFYGDVREEDFVTSGLALIEEAQFTKQPEGFTHVILNPPYKKINTQSKTRRFLNALGMEVTNLYAAFVWIAARLLNPEGELVAITPRSFCNGPYFRRFRLELLNIMKLKRIHVFTSRKKVFGDDNVLQENVIFHAIRTRRNSTLVVVSSSEDAEFKNSSIQYVPYERMVSPSDRDSFIHLLLNDEDDRAVKLMEQFNTSLGDLGIEVSTGRVVDFRAKEYLRYKPQENTVPLIYPCHFENGFVIWPAKTAKKPNAILSTKQTRNLMTESGYYVLTKRFSSKEQQKRVVAAIYDPYRIKASFVGFENHLNYFHIRGKGLPPNLARGLAMYLNCSLFDKYFRLFSGHTQVNATDLRKIKYPSREQLIHFGMHVKNRMPNQETIDAVFKKSI